MTRTEASGWIPVAVLLLACFTWAQQSTPSAPAAPQASPSTSSPANAPKGKIAPQAKSQPEFDAYKAAMNSANDAAAMEKVADDFAAKFPKSELTPILYRTAMQGYQNANNGAKMEAMGRKVLAADPDDPEALIGVAEAIVDGAQEADPGRNQKLDEAAKLAQHALQTIDTDIVIPAGTPQDKVDNYKAFLRASAYSVLGTTAAARQKDADAEHYFQQALAAFPSQPDPYVVLKLALTLDHESRYPDALAQANRAVQLTDEASAVGKAARQERDRLMQLTGAGTPPSSSTAPPVPGTTPAPH